LGQYNYYKANGYFQDCPDVTAKLGELVTGKKPGREKSEEINFAANLGLAMDDMAVAPLIYERAMSQGIGMEIPL